MTIHNIGKQITGQQGFSLVELLVVLALMGMIVSFVATSMLFSQRALNRWQTNIELHNKFHTLLNGIAEDVYRADVVREIARTRLRLIMADRDERLYEYKEGKIVRNGVPLHTGGVDITDFRIQQFQNEEQLLSAEIYRPGNEEETLLKISLAMVSGTDTLSASRVLSFRKGLAWKPLN